MYTKNIFFILENKKVLGALWLADAFDIQQYGQRPPKLHKFILEKLVAHQIARLSIEKWYRIQFYG